MQVGGSHPKMSAHLISLCLTLLSRHPRIKLFIVKYILIYFKNGGTYGGVSILLNSFNPLRRCIEL